MDLSENSATSRLLCVDALEMLRCTKQIIWADEPKVKRFIAAPQQMKFSAPQQAKNAKIIKDVNKAPGRLQCAAASDL
jgi:hypothetical protein